MYLFWFLFYDFRSHSIKISKIHHNQPAAFEFSKTVAPLWACGTAHTALVSPSGTAVRKGSISGCLTSKLSPAVVDATEPHGVSVLYLVVSLKLTSGRLRCCMGSVCLLLCIFFHSFPQAGFLSLLFFTFSTNTTFLLLFLRIAQASQRNPTPFPVEAYHCQLAVIFVRSDLVFHSHMTSNMEVSPWCYHRVSCNQIFMCPDAHEFFEQSRVQFPKPVRTLDLVPIFVNSSQGDVAGRGALCPAPCLVSSWLTKQRSSPHAFYFWWPVGILNRDHIILQWLQNFLKIKILRSVNLVVFFVLRFNVFYVTWIFYF